MLTLLRDAGFTGVQVAVRPEDRQLIRAWRPGAGSAECVVSATIEAARPA